MNVLCSAKACPVLLSTTCVFYEGENLIYTGINTNDNLQEALQKIDETIGNTFLAFVPLSRTITINGVTQDLSANRTWTIPSNNIYNSDGTLTGNRIVTVNDKQLVFRSNASTLQNYTFTIGTPTGITPSTWPASVVFEGEYLMSTANAEPYNTRVWGRNQSAGTRSLWVNQVFADITGESTGATNIYNQVFVTKRGSPTDTSTTATSTMRGVLSQVGHAYAAGFVTPATITTTNQDAYYAQNVNYTGNITNVVGFYAQSQAGYAGTPYTTNITNYYGFFQLTFVLDSKSTITNHYGLFLSTPTIATGGIITNRWGIYAPDIASRHYFNGNVLLGTTIDAGYKLDVNGTARISGVLTTGNGTGYAHTGQVVYSTSSSSNAYFEASSASGAYSALIFTKAGVLSTMWQVYTDSSNNYAVFRNGVNREIFKIFESTKNVGIDEVAGSSSFSDIPSAKLFVNSTTKGFLQPRMTTTERNAIASPATGLQVYNTTTNTNDYYNGTSWNTVSTGNIYTVDGTLTGNRTLTTAGNTLAFRTGGVDEFLFTPNNGSIFPIFRVFNSTFGGKIDLGPGYIQVGGGVFSLGNTNSGDITIFAGTQKAQLFGGTGNLLIQTGGTFTDAGYKLDVQGTARVSGQASFGQAIAYSAGIKLSGALANNSPSLFIAQWNSVGDGFDYTLNDDGILRLRYVNSGVANVNELMSFSRTGVLDINQNTTFYVPATIYQSAFSSIRYRLRNLPNYFVGYDSSDETVKLAVENDANPRYVSLGGSTTNGTVFNGVLNVRPNTGSVAIGVLSANTSSVLEVASTTKGFLPPRMTNTQRTAISTPAVGLMVYCTDSVEGYYVYTSLGWKSLTMV